MSEIISQLHELRILNEILQELRRNKNDTAFFCQHHISRKNRCPANPDRHIDATQHHLLDIRRIITFYPAIESIDLFKPFNISDRTIKYHAPVRMSINRVAQVVSD